MIDFAKIAPLLANPLVLVGFVLFLLFGIHRTLIKSGIIPPVDTLAAPDIVKVILRYGFIASIVVIVLGFVYAGLQSYIKAAFLTGKLSVVSADIDDQREGKFPLLDISLRNDGKSVAAIKAIDFDITNVWLLKSPFKPAARLITGEYDVMLPLSGRGCTIQKKLDQDVQSNETDRFTIVLGNDAHPSYDKYLMNVVARILYDEDDKEINVGSFVFVTAPMQEPIASNVNRERRIAASIYNQYVLGAISKIEASKFSPSAADWRREQANFIPEALSYVSNESNPKDNKLNALSYIGDMGDVNKPYINKIASIKIEDQDIQSSINETISRINKVHNPIPDLTDVRDDGHKGCSEASHELLMKYSAPF